MGTGAGDRRRYWDRRPTSAPGPTTRPAAPNAATDQRTGPADEPG